MTTETPVLVSFLFNLVVLPASDPLAADPLWQISATRMDRELRLISTPCTKAELESTMARLGVSSLQYANLLRGNRMANGGRDASRLFFSEAQLLAAGLVPWSPPAQEAKL